MPPKHKLTEKIPAETKKSSKIFILAVIVLFIILALAYIYKGLFIAALVNGQPIPRTNVISELERQGGNQVLDVLITNALILQEAKKKNINISQKEIDTQLKEIEKNVTSQGLTLDKALQQEKLTKAALIEQIRLQLSLQKLVGRDVTVSDQEVEKYINENKDQLTETDPEKQKAQVRQQLKLQKEQDKIQEFISKLKNKAKINYFVGY